MGESRRSRQTNKSAGKSGNPVSRLFRSLAVFISEILAELRKVVRPTRSELWNYTIVVIVFVSVMMALVSGLDFGFQKLVALVFGNGGD
ncbi:preprotein translocase subunit SecE [Knoellia sinensis KCTC 19936]|uniref:Protein translocase subunit SecE n=1 Tax=Knoellia sinensis KCTC 19936 TaxID=1385520 RepID=A0A0A0JAF2_9MICO|nr:preprotein translocase subunit SecE [Knoellia sinensis KCTC 19936]